MLVVLEGVSQQAWFVQVGVEVVNGVLRTQFVTQHQTVQSVKIIPVAKK